MSVFSVQGEQSVSSEITTLTNLTALGISGAGEFLRKTSATEFENATISEIVSLSGLSDVSISSPSSGQVLSYNGSSWVNSATATFTQIITPVIYGGAAANDDITIEGTSHATKTTSYVILQPTSGNVGIGTTTPNNLLQVFDLIDFNNTDYNTKIGYQAGKNIVAGAANNVFIGSQAGLSSVASSTNTADNNVGIGRLALQCNAEGSGNIAIGTNALGSNTNGIDNIGIGPESLYANLTGNYNVGIGKNSLMSSTGSENTGVGNVSLYRNTSGNQNTGIGRLALYENATGNRNVALGYGAGRWETGSDKLFIDNAPRANEADGRIKAILYGIMAAATADQKLTINALLHKSVQAGITADTGSAQGGSPITANIVEISVCATTGDSVTLPTAVAGLQIIITNHGAASADVFPATDDAINEGAANAAKALAADASMMCVAYDAVNWECLTLAR